MAKKTKFGALHVKQLSVGGVEITPKPDEVPPVLPKVAYSESTTIKGLRADYNELVRVLRWAGIVGSWDE